ncbi:hypothetical protein ABH933_004396 [Nocardia sp. GP40]
MPLEAAHWLIRFIIATPIPWCRNSDATWRTVVIRLLRYSSSRSCAVSWLSAERGTDGGSRTMVAASTHSNPNLS